MNVRVTMILLIAFAADAVGAQTHNAARSKTKISETRIEGAGSLAINPLLSAWIEEYGHLHPKCESPIRALGSRAAFRMLKARTASFGAIDVPVADNQLTLINGRLLQVPVAITAVVPVYNLAGVEELHFSSSTLAGIFLGRITKWNDPAIAIDNPGLNLQRMDIKVKHYFPNRSVETHIMADYLSKVSPDFKTTLTASSDDWPLASKPYKGAEGVAGFVSDTPGSISYLGLVPARLYKHSGSLKYGAVKNSEGDFVTASPESLAAASNSAVSHVDKQTADFRVSITNAPGKASYPIASFIWLILYENARDSLEDSKKNQILRDFLSWVLTDGQTTALKLGYPRLPSDLVKTELQHLEVGIR